MELKKQKIIFAKKIIKSTTDEPRDKREYATLEIPSQGTVTIQAVLPDNSVVDLIVIDTRTDANKISKIIMMAKIAQIDAEEEEYKDIEEI